MNGTTAVERPSYTDRRSVARPDEMTIDLAIASLDAESRAEWDALMANIDCCFPE